MLKECSPSVVSHDSETHTVSSEQSTPNREHGDSQSDTDLMSSPSNRLTDVQQSNHIHGHGRDNGDPPVPPSSAHDINNEDTHSPTTDHEPGQSEVSIMPWL